MAMQRLNGFGVADTQAFNQTSARHHSNVQKAELADVRMIFQWLP
jgi:hypothetical protein